MGMHKGRSRYQETKVQQLDEIDRAWQAQPRDTWQPGDLDGERGPARYHRSLSKQKTDESALYAVKTTAALKVGHSKAFGPDDA